MAYCQTLLSTIIGSDGTNLTHLSHIPIWFGDFDTVTPADAYASTNHKNPCFAQQILHFCWAVYSFGGGHFAATISSHNFPFCVKIACNQYESGCALFCEFTSCTGIFNSRNKMLDYICASGDKSQIHGYLIHSIQFTDSDTIATSWQLQGTIVAQLRSLCDLQVIVATVLPNHDGQCLSPLSDPKVGRYLNRCLIPRPRQYYSRGMPILLVSIHHVLQLSNLLFSRSPRLLPHAPLACSLGAIQ